MVYGRDKLVLIWYTVAISFVLFKSDSNFVLAKILLFQKASPFATSHLNIVASNNIKNYGRLPGKDLPITAVKTNTHCEYCTYYYTHTYIKVN